MTRGRISIFRQINRQADVRSISINLKKEVKESRNNVCELCLFCCLNDVYVLLYYRPCLGTRTSDYTGILGFVVLCIDCTVLVVQIIADL